MIHRSAVTVVVLGSLIVGAAFASPAPDRRGTPIVRLGCTSDIGHREITLFGNGTVRVLEGARGAEPVLRLGELEPAEAEAAVAQLRREDLSETDPDAGTVSGEWVERCELDLALPGQGPRRFAFRRFDALSLPLARAVALVEGLAERTALVRSEHLPPGYAARIGDVLRRVDGTLFEVVAFTADGLGVELQGLVEPLTLYLTKDAVPLEFVALESRRVGVRE